jgi:ferredoxin
MGLSWSASPVRRLVQACFFLLFLVLFFHVAWPYGSTNYSRLMRDKEFIDAELFLAIDPLVSLSAALAGRLCVWSLTWAAVLLCACLVLPRIFCSCLCPLGTVIDLFDWAVNRPLRSLFRALRGLLGARDGTGARVRPAGAVSGEVPSVTVASAWRHLRYFLLAGILVSSASGVLLSGYFAPVPVVTRGFQFTVSLLELGLRRGWHQVPPFDAGCALSVGLFAAVLGLGLVRPRFWCRYVCPSGAILSLVNQVGLTRRSVTADCTGCGRCGRVCSFDAIEVDFATRVGDCTFCQTCGGVCPVGAIRFAVRSPGEAGSGRGAAPACPADSPPAGARRESMPAPPAGRVSRRGFLSGVAAGSAAGVAGALGLRMLPVGPGDPPVRPPGSLPEREFLRLCIRCGECFRVCPNNVLQPMGFAGGLYNLWTPAVRADWSGCEPTCNNCGQVCPTGAIRAIGLDEKRLTRIALAVVDEQTCLQCAGSDACETTGRDGRPSLICRDECESAGYHAIDLVRLPMKTDRSNRPAEGSGFLVPMVVQDKCVGCGLCQTRCYNINVKARGLLSASAIRVVAGEGKEDRLIRGSAMELRAREAAERARARPQRPTSTTTSSDYITDF